MKARKCVVGAALAAMACSAVAQAADQTASNLVSLNPVYMDASTPTTSTPLMYLLEQGSVGKWMDSNKLSITGFVEGGYFYDASAPRLGTDPAKGQDSPTLIGFPGAYSNRGLLDQADITFQKTIDSTKSWDFGFVIEGGYGTDDALIHSYGILDNRAAPTIDNKFNSNPSAGSPQNQLDLVQANASFLVPLGTGLTIEAGKFVTPFGYETINPTNNPFYTHSYLFTFGLPLTQTGVTGSYTFGKLVNGNDLTITGGITRGWNESSLDNNGEVDFLGSAVTKLDAAGKAGLAVNVSEGPETYEAFAGDKGDSHNYWTVVEAIPSYQVSDQFKVAADLLYADFPHGSIVATNSTGGLSGATAQWYSACLYAGYKINNYLTLNGRGEYYRDQGGFTVGTGYSANYYEATAGVQIHPFPSNDILQWLQFRPEVRYDLSDKPVYNASHDTAISGAGDYTQFTVAVDAIMQF
jgi:hypothetical protein